MAESQSHDPDCSSECHELETQTSVGRPHAISSSTEETRASQPKTQSNLMHDHSEDFIPSDKRKWSDIPANGEIRGRPLENRISKRVTSLVRHLDLKERETDGAVHWTSRKKADIHSLILNGLMISGKEATKLDFHIARTPTMFYCVFAPSKGIPEES